MASHHSCFICLLGVLLCVFQLCTPISGPRVKVAAELVMISGFLYRKGDLLHYSVIKWKRILRYCPLLRGIHQSPVDSLHKGTVIRTLGVSVLFVWTTCWTNSRLTGDSRRHDGHRCNIWVRVYSITKWIGVISKQFSKNVTKVLPINPQKGKLQNEKHTSLSCEKSSIYEGGHNAGT